MEGLLQVFEVVTILLAGEAGASLADALELAVTLDVGMGIVHLQRAEQGYQGGALLRGTGVGFMSMLVESSLVANADGVGIVVEGVHAYFLLRSCLVELAITGDVVVVADALAMKLGVMTRPEVFDGETLIAACCGAMDDDEGDFTHDCTNNVELMAVRMVTTI